MLDGFSAYQTLGELGEALGFEWGGRWRIRDLVHFEDLGGKSMQQLDAEHRADIR
jgi:hypothetical protein